MHAEQAPVNSTHRVLRNASFLLGAQILSMPLSILVNALIARSLGAGQYGLYYQIFTIAGFAFLFVEWGQPAVLTGLVATDRGRAGELLGSGLASRILAAIGVGAAVLAAVMLAGYEQDFVSALLLALVVCLLGTLAGACHDVYRGYERGDFAALCIIGGQLLGAAVVVPVLLAGGHLYGLLWSQMACAALGAAFLLWMAPRLHIPSLAVRPGVIKELWQRGHPFLLFAMVLALQPVIEATLLSQLGTQEETGWYAAARKLLGVLTFPASALITSLYPTLCRLRAEGGTEFNRTVTDALQLVVIVAVPLALGCALYPELGVGIFGQQAFGPAEDNLRILAAWLFLMYFSMPMGCCLTACGRQRGWTCVLLAGVATSSALIPFLLPWFQANAGNGGLGVCLAAVAGEIVTVIGAACLLPRGLLASVPVRRWLLPLGAGAVMCLVAFMTRHLQGWISAVLAGFAYLVLLQLAGVINLLRPRALVAFLRQ